MARSFAGGTDLASVASGMLGLLSNSVANVYGIMAAAWIFPTSSLTAYQTVFDGASSRQCSAFLGGAANHLFIAFGGATGAEVALSDSWALNVWQHLAISFDGTTALIYRNGVQVGSASAAVAAGSFLGQGGAQAWKIGNVGGGGGGVPYVGRIAEAGVWGVKDTTAVLAANDVLALASGAPPCRVRPSSLVFYAPLWGLQSPEPDLSGNGNSGTLTGTAQANHAPVTTFTRKSRTTVEPAAAAAGGLLMRRRRALVA